MNCVVLEINLYYEPKKSYSKAHTYRGTGQHRVFRICT